LSTQCVILAGGLGTRLGGLAEATPNALVPVAGRPFAEHQLAWLAREGVTDVVYSIGHLGEQIRGFVEGGGRWGLRVRYVDEGSDLLGTAGALRLAYDEGVLEPDFGVLYGDSFLRLTLRDAWDAFRRLRPAVLMTVFRNEDRFDRSNARLQGDWVVRYDKAEPDPAGNGMLHIDYGFSVIDRDAVLPDVPRGQAVDLADVCRRLSSDGRIAGLEVAERFYEIGSPEGLAELDALLKSGSTA
jgi:NDP-sugar pyrophosphorylase family protein